MTDHEAAAWTRGHAVGERELRAAEQRWQVERSMLIAQRDARAAETERLRAENDVLQRQSFRGPFLMSLALNFAWLIANALGVI